MDKLMYDNNIVIFIFVLKKFSLKYTYLVLPINFYFSWLLYSRNFTKIYKNKRQYKYKNFIISDSNFINSKSMQIYNIIKFKNNSGLLKNEFNFKKYIFNKLVTIKRKYRSRIKKKKFYLNRSYDLKLKMRGILKKNRTYLSFFLKKKFKNIHKYSKYIKNFTKRNYIKTFLSSELLLKNILLRVKYFSSENELNRFFLEGSVFVNGKRCTNLNLVLTVNDVISVSFNKNYFLYFRTKSEKYTFMFNRIVNVNLRKKFSFNSKISEKVKNLTHFRSDIPKFIEVDYLTMTSVIIYNPMIYKEYSHYLYKYLNFHSSRIYNWKCIN